MYELSRFPPVHARSIQHSHDLRVCESMIRQGSKSFFMASLLLPREVRNPALSLYAFCRLSDDAVDAPAARSGAVDGLQARLDAIYAGRPGNHPVDRAMAETVSYHQLPRELPEALLEGLAWDARGDIRFETLSDVLSYSVRVAGAVGAMMSVLMGVRTPRSMARAIDLGVAMQLTNIARDVGEDARMSRLYLPRAWMREAGLDPDAWLAAPTFGPGLAEVVGRLLAEADSLYRRADAGIPTLPGRCRPAIRAARLIYAEIGVRLRQSGLDSVSTRTVVPRARKLALLARAQTITRWDQSALDAPVLAEGAYLCNAAAVPDAAGPPAALLPWWNIGTRTERVIELFDRLERRDREQALST